MENQKKGAYRETAVSNQDALNNTHHAPAACVCVFTCVYVQVVPSENYSTAQSPHTAQVVQTKTYEVLPRE